MKKILVIFLLGLGFLNELQSQVPWSVSGTKTRFTKGLGIPVADTMPGGIADTAQLLIRPQDGRLYVKYKTGWQLAIGDFVPYTGATTNVTIGDYRVSARTFLNDSILARTSAGAKLLSNSGSTVAEYGVGGGDNMDFHGFAGYNANRSSSYTARSFTDKNYADSSVALRLRISDTAAMLANRLKISDTSQILDKTIRTFGNQTDITGNKTFTNNIIANSFATASGTVSQLLVANGSILDNTNIHTGAPTFDTTGRTLTIPTVSGGSYSVVIPRGTSSGAEGITAITTSRIGNLLTVSGDNGSNSTISIRDADSASTMRYADTASMLSPYRRTSTLIQQSEVNGLSTSLAAKVNVSDTASMLSNYRRTTTKITNSDLASSTISGVSLGSNLASLTAGYGLSGTAYSGSTGYTWIVDTGSISTKANVTGLLVGYATTGSVAAKLNISDTAAMLSNLLRKTDTATMLLPFMQYSDTAFMLSPYARTSNLPDFSAKLNTSDTAAMLSNYRRTTTKITNSDLVSSAITINGSSTSLGGTINVGTVTSVGLTAPTGFTVSNSPVTSSGNIGLSFTAGYSLPTTASQALWDIAYNKRIVSASLNTTQLTLTLGDASTVTASVPTFNQNTTGTAASLSAVLSKTLGGAGDVNGILKANGTGTVSAAVAGDITSLISGTYLPLSAGSGQPLSGDLYGTNLLFSGYGSFGTISSTATNLVAITSSYAASNTERGSIAWGDGSGIVGKIYSTYNGSNSTKLHFGGLYNGSYNGADVMVLDGITNSVTLSGTLNGTSLSMSGGGSFLGNVGIGTSSPTSPLSINKTIAANTTYVDLNNVTNTFNNWGVDWSVTSGNVPVAAVRAIYPTTNDVSLGFYTYNSGIANVSERGRFASDGTFLINTTTTDGVNKLIVNGGVKAEGMNLDATSANGSGKVNMYSNGVRFAYFGTGAWALSDGTTDLAFGAESGRGFKFAVNGTTSPSFTIASTGAATFSSSVYGLGYRFAYAAKSSNYTLTDNDDYITVTNASTITLPTAVGRAGKRYVLRSTATAGVTSTLATTSSQTVDGAAGTFAFGNGNYNILIVFSDGANWLSEQWITGS